MPRQAASQPQTPISSDEDILERIAENAHQTVLVAEAAGLDLPVETGSLAVLDRILDEDGFGVSPDDLDEVITCAGCFVGQVLCEDRDGTWAMDPDHGLHVRFGGVHVSPFAWVHRRVRFRDKPLVERLHDLDRSLERYG